jgi:selenocysteine lyase/cysteine desulfurase
MRPSIGDGMLPVDVEKLRAETPGVEHRVHLNNAGAGLMPEPVLRAITDHLELESRIGGYEAEEAKKAEIASVYTALGTLIGATRENVAVTENATVSFSQALSSVPFVPGDLIVTSRNDYISNQLMYLSLQNRMGIEFVRAPEDPAGGVDMMAMEELIHRRRPKLVAITHIPTNSGLVQRVADIGAMCRQRDILYLVDACQSVGQMPIDVEEIGCDFLSATARKFLRGPRGIGFLYVSDRALDLGLEPLFPDMRGADWIEADLYQPAPGAQRFENWEFPHALVLGMGKAAEYALAVGLEPARDRVRSLADMARELLGEIDSVRVLDRGEEKGAIVTVTAERAAGELVAGLAAAGINTNVTARAYAILDFDDKGVEFGIRISPHYYNTEDEIALLADILKGLVS